MTKAFVIASAVLACTAFAATPPLPASRPTPAQEKAILGALAWHFEENHGQAAPAVRYVARGDGYQVEIRDGGPTLVSINKGKRVEVRTLAVWSQSQGGNYRGRTLRNEIELLPRQQRKRTGERTSPVSTGFRYHDIYPNIDLMLLRLRKESLEFDFEVRPGGNPDLIAMTWEEGAKKESPSGCWTRI